MADNSWYTSTGWDESEQNIFFAKIKRARAQRVYYTLVKARTLYSTNNRTLMDAGIKLLVDGLDLYKDEEFDLPNMAEALGYWYFKERQFILSEKYLRCYFDLLKSGKIARITKISLHELLAELLMLKSTNESMSEAKTLIDQWHTERDTKNRNERPYFPSFKYPENFDIRDVLGNPITSIEEACDGFEIHHSDLDYALVHQRNQMSLDYLWEHLSEVATNDEYKISNYSWYRTEKVIVSENPTEMEYRDLPGELFWFIPEMGAYLGQTIANLRRGNWAGGDRLMQKRVIVNGHKINPFLMAYEIVRYRFPIKYAAKIHDLYTEKN